MHVKAKIPFTWRRGKYSAGQPLPADELQAKKLVAAGLAYYDTGNEQEDGQLTEQAIEYQNDCGCS